MTIISNMSIGSRSLSEKLKERFCDENKPTITSEDQVIKILLN